MSYSVIAEDYTLKHLNNLSGSDSQCFVVGLIIGQVNILKKKVYAIHLAPTPEQSKNPDVNSLQDVDEILVGEHARFITRMLVGGLSIIGIFVISANELFPPVSTFSASLRRILSQISKSLGDGFPLEANSLCTDRFIFHFNPNSKRFCCKSIPENLVGILANVDWKFQSFTSSWIEVASKIYLDEKELSVSASSSVKDQLLALLSQLSKKINDSVILLNGLEVDGVKSIGTVADRKGINNEKIISTSFYTPYPQESSKSDVTFFTSEIQRLTVGTIPSRIFLDPNMTVSDAIHAVKQDLVRTLGARLELHWDSLVDEEGGSPEEKERVHEPPRRVLVQPEGWRVCFADYIFPGEGASAAVKSCQDLLDIEITEICVDATFEGSPERPGCTSNERCDVGPRRGDIDAWNFISGSIDETNATNKSSFHTSSNATIQIFCLCLVVLLAIVLHFILR